MTFKSYWQLNLDTVSRLLSVSPHASADSVWPAPKGVLRLLFYFKRLCCSST